METMEQACNADMTPPPHKLRSPTTLKHSPSHLLTQTKSPSFRISSSTVTFEDPASLHKKVTVEEATMSAAPFAGAQYLVDGNTGTWSKYYPLDYIKRSPDKIPITSNDEEQVQALSDAVEAGQAAGKIYVRWNTGMIIPQIHDGPALSGFWLNEDFFLTCAHGLKSATEDGNYQEILNQMCSEADTQCCVGSQGCERKATDRGNQPVKLWAYDLVEDIAIFRACRSRPSIAGRVGPSLSIHDLDILPSSPVDSTYIFSIAYCSDNSPYVEKDYPWKSKDQATNNKAKEWREKFPSREFRVFDCMMIYNMLNLEQSADGAIIKAAMTKNTREEVKFFIIFKPHSRALAVGKVISQAAGLVDLPNAEPYVQRELLEEQPCSISAFHGCSGAMVGTIKNVEGATLSYKVIGIMAGGEYDRPVNKFNAFTAKGIKWIEDHLSTANTHRNTSP